VSNLSLSQMLASLGDVCEGHPCPVHPGDAQGDAPLQGADSPISASEGEGNDLSAQEVNDLLQNAKADIKGFLDAHEIAHKIGVKDSCTLLELQHCPFNPDHQNSGFLIYPNGTVQFNCFHESCQNNHFDKAVIKLATGDEGQLQSILMESRLAAMNRDHAVVNLNGKCAILREGIDPVTNFHMVTFSSVGDFHNLQKNNKGRVSSGKGFKDLPVSNAWLEWPGRRGYDAVIFEPGKDVKGCYNLWRGFAVEPKPGDCSLFIDHILNVIAGGDKELAGYIIAWMADAVQNPGGPRPGTSIALRGVQGCGKGTLVNIFGRLFGTHFLHLSGSDQLTGRFNDHLKSVIIVFADEAVWGGDKSAEGKLKGMVTEPTMFVEPKGMNGFSISNHIRLILASNNDWIVPAGLEERRFLVLDVSPNRVGDYEYFAAIEKQMTSGGLEALLHYLLDYDLSTINLRQIPRTPALFEQITASMSAFDKFWLDRLTSGELFELVTNRALSGFIETFGCYNTDWPAEVRVADLNTEFQLYCKELNVRYRTTNTQMGKALSQSCPSVERKRGSTGRRDYYYQIPSLQVCRTEFERRVKMKIDWS
jgi:hypothetical protein